MAPFPQNRSCGRETPCKSSFPLWHGRPVHRLHRRDNENRKGEAGASLHAAAGAYHPGGRAVLFAIHGRFFVARSPVFLHRPALWQQREGIRRIFDTPSTSSSARGKKGRYWRFVHLYYTKMRPPCKEKRGKNRCPPSILCSRPPGYTRPPFFSDCTKGRPIGEMPCGGIPHAGMCGVAACSASACARWVW